MLKEQKGLKDEKVAIARAAYEAYVTKDRAAIERLIAEDFCFTSPLDNCIDRATYFARCWPNSEWIEDFDYINLVPGGDRVFVTYEGKNTDGRRFRNTEILTYATVKSRMSRSILDGRFRIRQIQADSCRRKTQAAAGSNNLSEHVPLNRFALLSRNARAVMN